MKISLIIIVAFIFITGCKITPVVTEVGLGWAKTSVNTTIFRKNSLVSDAKFQYIAYYDSTGHVILGKRKHGSSEWILNQTQYTGNVKDAHNIISIMVDGDGYLHVCWDHHNGPLNYAKSVAPQSLELGDKLPMTGTLEDNLVTYPEFYALPDGGMYFVYRHGASGAGNIVLNRYRLKEKRWERIQDNLVSGDGLRNAYWQMAVDNTGAIHLSYVWRDTWDVATNHNLCYARSVDGGKNWTTSNNKPLPMPITYEVSEIAMEIPQNSNLINQTSITTDAAGHPAIASYWTAVGDSITQFYVVYHNGEKWNLSKASSRTTAFSLSGGGTRRIPISRPQLLAKSLGADTRFFLVYRDAEANNCVVVATAVSGENMVWQQKVLHELEVGQWEPSYDTELWRHKGVFALFVQKTGQGSGDEKPEELDAQMVKVLQMNESQMKQLFEE